MPDLPDFQRKQMALAAHIRDPDNRPAPENIENRRLAIYRDLFYNNLQSLLSSTFPVLKKLHTKVQWQGLVRDFMVQHRSGTPYFLEIPQEFCAWLAHSRERRDGDFPFLHELAHYEWMELALSVSELDNDCLQIDTAGDLLDGPPVQSVLAWPLVYRYPVHRISPDFLPAAPDDEPTRLVIIRNANDELGFRELNAVTGRLLEMIAGNAGGETGREILLRLAGEISFDPQAMLQHGADMLARLRTDGILIGTRRSST